MAYVPGWRSWGIGARRQRPLDALEVAAVGGGVERARARLQGHDAAHDELSIYGGLVAAHGSRRDCDRRRCGGAFCVANALANLRSLKFAVVRRRNEFPAERARAVDVKPFCGARAACRAPLLMP